MKSSGTEMVLIKKHHQERGISDTGAKIFISDRCTLILVDVKVKVLAAQSCLTLFNPMNYSLPGSSVHGILQARILEWVAILFSMGSSWPRDPTQVSCTAGRFFTAWAKIYSILLQMSNATLKVNNIITLSSKDVSNVLVLLATQSCSGNRKSLGRYMDGWAHF